MVFAKIEIDATDDGRPMSCKITIDATDEQSPQKYSDSFLLNLLARQFNCILNQIRKANFNCYFSFQ